MNRLARPLNILAARAVAKIVVGNPDILHPEALLNLDNLINAEPAIGVWGKFGVDMVIAREHFLRFRKTTLHQSVIGIFASALRQTRLIIAERTA